MTDSQRSPFSGPPPEVPTNPWDVFNWDDDIEYVADPLYECIQAFELKCAEYKLPVPEWINAARKTLSELQALEEEGELTDDEFFEDEELDLGADDLVWYGRDA